MEHSSSHGGAPAAARRRLSPGVAAARRALRTAVSVVTVVALALVSATPTAASRYPSFQPVGFPPVHSSAVGPEPNAYLLAADSGPRPRSTVRYTDPLTGGRTPSRVTRGFDPPAQDWLPGHRGVDLAASPGTPVLAAAAGTVAFAGQVAGNPVVSIDHADGLRTTYQPVRAAVRRGQEVAGGEHIGVVVAAVPGRAPSGGGQPGGSGGEAAHDGLHWGARPSDSPTAYVDPLALLEAAVIRLKPLRPGDGPAGRRA
ncbi:M23 family metallopeptidase [Corynebacterium frankenforstense]